MIAYFSAMPLFVQVAVGIVLGVILLGILAVLAQLFFWSLDEIGHIRWKSFSFSSGPSKAQIERAKRRADLRASIGNSVKSSSPTER